MTDCLAISTELQLCCIKRIYATSEDHRPSWGRTLAFLAKKSGNRIFGISRTFGLLRKATRDSYRLDKCMYEPLNISLASSFNCIHAYQKEIKLIGQAIEKCINGISPNSLMILQSIPGTDPV